LSMSTSTDPLIRMFVGLLCKQMTQDEAMERVMAAEAELYDTGIVFTWRDDSLGCTDVVVVGLTEGKDRAEELVASIARFRALALKGGELS
jgi:hypothetical protein